MSTVHVHATLLMEEDQSNMTEVICDLALEVIFLLTGERHAAVKMASIEGLLQGAYPPMSAEGQTPVTKPSPQSKILESKNQKILDVINKMAELMAGEVKAPGKSDVACLTLKEKENVEKDPFLNLKMEAQPLASSLDKCKKRNSPERSIPPPLTQKPPESLLEDQIDNEIRIIEVKEEPDSDEEWCIDQETSTDSYQHDNLVVIKLDEDKHEDGGVQSEEADDSPHASDGWGQTQEIHEKTPDNVSNGVTQSDTIASDSSKHPKAHTQEKPFSWNECWNVPPQTVQMGDKPYSCAECGKSFSTKASLIGHEQLHIGEIPYTCTECGKCFSQKFSLVSHKRVHREKTTYVCSVCGRCFYQRSHLTSHERVHTGEKPYSCSLCGKHFSDRTVLVRHARIHTGEKPYSCSECGKCFTQRANLTRHELVHAGKNAQ